MKRLFIALLGSVLITPSCTQPRNLLGQLNTPYHDLQRALTKEARFFGLEKVHYQTSITYKSKALRRAYVEEYALRYHSSDKEKEELLKRELDEAEKFQVFFVSHYATDKDSARITREDKVWRLSLENEIPENVLSVSSQDSVLQYFYPQISPWSKSYNVQFKNSGDLQKFQVRMSGVDGDLEFTWDLKDDQL